MKKNLFAGLRSLMFPCTLFLALALTLFSSCKKDEKKDEYKVKYTVNCNGRFVGTPTIVYTNSSGVSLTENLTVNKEWIKEVSGDKSFVIKAAIVGVIDSGEVILSSSASKNGTTVDIGETSQSSWSNTPITVDYESTFE